MSLNTVCLLYYYFLEASGILDSENELHLLALRFVYTPRLQQLLQAFRNVRNVHGLSSVHSAAPLQLWTAGMLLNRQSNHQAVAEVFSRTDLDSRVRASSDSESDSITGPDSIHVLELLDELRHHYDPLASSHI